jgi:molecular chaperone IbpA
MNNRTLTLRSLDIPSIHKFGIGFDSMMEELMRMTEAQQTNYPPYNILRIDENEFVIQVAVAGFGEDEVRITVERNVLSIIGEKLTAEPPVEYIHKGISDRVFKKEFTLAEHVEVREAMVTNGILAISLRRLVPEVHAPKTIDIKFNK